LRLDQRFSRGGGDCLVRFDSAIAADVKHGVPAFSEDAADEQSSVAMCGVFFAANQCYSKALDPSFEANDGCLKLDVVAKAAIDYAA
jgi:type II secretory pathway predicted ATPase ExeA